MGAIETAIDLLENAELGGQMDKRLENILQMLTKFGNAFYDYKTKDLLSCFVSIVEKIYQNKNLNELAPDKYQETEFFAKLTKPKLTKRDIIFNNLSYREFFNEEKNPPFLGFSGTYWGSLCSNFIGTLRSAKSYLNNLENLAELCNSKMYKQYNDFSESKITIDKLLNDDEYYDTADEFKDLRELINSLEGVKEKYGSDFDENFIFYLDNFAEILKSKKKSKHFNAEEKVDDNFMLKVLHYTSEQIDSISAALNRLNKPCGK